MKVYFYCLVYVAFCTQALAQQGTKLLGAHSNGNNQVFASINLSGGSYSQISVLNSPFNSSNVETTFDDLHSRYFVKNASTIYVIDALTGNLLDSVSNAGTFYNMEYDQFSNSLIGLSPNSSSIVCKTINLTTKTQITKSTLVSVDSIIVGESTFDPINRRYFTMTNLGVIVIDSTGVMRDVLCSSPGLLGMEYFPTTNLIFYLESNNGIYLFVSVETTNCSINYHGELNGITSALRGESTSDKTLGLYYHKTNVGIIQIDSYSGLVQQILSPINNFGGMEIKTDPTATGIGIESDKKEIIVFPNPSNLIFHFKNLKVGARLEIFDSRGRSCLQKKIQDSSFELNMEGQYPGIYFYTIQTFDTKTQTGKLILE